VSIAQNNNRMTRREALAAGVRGGALTLLLAGAAWLLRRPGSFTTPAACAPDACPACAARRTCPRRPPETPLATDNPTRSS